MTSADGTVIGYTRHGDGPPMILVGGGLDDGTETPHSPRRWPRTVLN